MPIAYRGIHLQTARQQSWYIHPLPGTSSTQDRHAQPLETAKIGMWGSCRLHKKMKWYDVQLIFKGDKIWWTIGVVTHDGPPLRWRSQSRIQVQLRQNDMISRDYVLTSANKCRESTLTAFPHRKAAWKFRRPSYLPIDIDVSATLSSPIKVWAHCFTRSWPGVRSGYVFSYHYMPYSVHRNGARKVFEVWEEVAGEGLTPVRHQATRPFGHARSKPNLQAGPNEAALPTAGEGFGWKVAWFRELL